MNYDFLKNQDIILRYQETDLDIYIKKIYEKYNDKRIINAFRYYDIQINKYIRYYEDKYGYLFRIKEYSFFEEYKHTANHYQDVFEYEFLEIVPLDKFNVLLYDINNEVFIYNILEQRKIMEAKPNRSADEYYDMIKKYNNKIIMKKI